MKEYHKSKGRKVQNWLKDQSTVDEIWHEMASKWALAAESASKYSKSHIAEPVKTAFAKSVQQPFIDMKHKMNTTQAEKQVSYQRNLYGEYGK